MIELITTPKIAILFAIISTIILTVVLTGFIAIAGLPIISAFAFCFPLSIVVIGGLMIAGGLVFHAHKKITE